MMTPPTAPNETPRDLQTHGRSLLGTLYMLARAVKLYDPQNAIFLKPLEAMQHALMALLEQEGKVDLTLVEGSFYLNGELLRIEQGAVDNLHALADEMIERQIAGFALSSPPGEHDLRNFLWVFGTNKSTQQNDPPDEDGVAGHKLETLRITRAAEFVERLDKAQFDGTIDPVRHALVLYARALFFVHHELQARQKEPLAFNKVVRLVQDLIDVVIANEAVLLSSLQYEAGETALTFHLVNTTVLAIVFGKQIGLSKLQQKELGIAALTNEMGLCNLPEESQLTTTPERLEPVAQAQRQTAILGTATAALCEPSVGRMHHLRALSTTQMHEPFLHAVKDERGRTTLEPRGDPLYFSRVLAMCSYLHLLLMDTCEHAALPLGEALCLMWKNERWRFDPQLLGVFVRVMAHEPVRVRSRDDRPST